MHIRFAIAAAAFAMAAPATASPDMKGFAVTSAGRLVSFAMSAPGKAKRLKPVKGLARGERITGIDFRPSDKLLYAVTDRSQLYTVDPATGIASRIGLLTQTLTGNSTGTDFNPVPDRLRIVNDADQNLRANPADAVSANDKPLAYKADDPGAGSNPEVGAAGYINNVAGAKSTTLYVIDTGRDVLATQAPPNDGVLNTVGPLGIDVSGLAGFDIATDAAGANHAYAVLQRGRAGKPRLYRIDLATGKASDLGALRADGPVAGLAIALP